MSQATVPAPSSPGARTAPPAWGGGCLSWCLALWTPGLCRLESAGPQEGEERHQRSRKSSPMDWHEGQPRSRKDNFRVWLGTDFIFLTSVSGYSWIPRAQAVNKRVPRMLYGSPRCLCPNIAHTPGHFPAPQMGRAKGQSAARGTGSRTASSQPTGPSTRPGMVSQVGQPMPCPARTGFLCSQLTSLTSRCCGFRVRAPSGTGRT